MMKCMAMLAACLGLCVTALPARASGGVMCEAADDSLAFDFSAGQSRDGAGDWFGLQGKLVSKIDHLPPDLAGAEIECQAIVCRPISPALSSAAKT